MQQKKLVTPGDHLSVTEEFAAGDWTYVNGASVRALCPGEASYDLKERVVKVSPFNYKLSVPKLGDTVVGEVESFQNGIVNVRIDAINGNESSRGFVGMIILPHTRAPGRLAARPGDIMRAKVESKVNNIIHLTMEGKDLGVIHAACSMCGGNVGGIGSAARCIECGYSEPRKLALDFGKATLVKGTQGP